MRTAVVAYHSSAMVFNYLRLLYNYLESQLQKAYLLRLLHRYTPRNERTESICRCDPDSSGEAIPLLNDFAMTSLLRPFYSTDELIT